MGEVWFEGSILFLLLLAALPALAALAIILDRKSRRGYGLALLSAAALTLDVWGIISLSLAAQQFNADSEKLLFDLMVAEYFLIGLYIAFVLIVGGIVETAIACQWWWLALFAALSFILQ